jgi:formylglycine-generating enzyme required for sulfatase activity
LIDTSTVTLTLTPENTETSIPEDTLVPSTTVTKIFELSSTPTTETIPTITPIPFEILNRRGVISVTMIYVPQGETEIKDFYIDQYPVTNEQFVEFLNWFEPTSPSHWFSVDKSEYLFEEDGQWKITDSSDAQKPVSWVTWSGAERFCKWIEGRLPLEAEWEKAAGLGFDERKYPWGNNIDCRYANYYGCPAGEIIEISDCSRNISPYKVCDLAGNVAEWVDGYDPQKSEFEAIVKGGSYRMDEYYLQIDKSLFHPMDSPEKDHGFRCAIDWKP